jgi:cytochrome c biogenesis protein CcdA
MKISKKIFFGILLIAAVVSVFSFFHASLYAERKPFPQDFGMVLAQESDKTVNVHLFYSKDCGSCIAVISDLEKKALEDGRINIDVYELSEKDNAALLFYLFAAMDVQEKDYAIPVIFLEDHIFFGKSQFTNNFDDALKEVRSAKRLEDRPGALIEKFHREAAADKGIIERNYIRVPVVMVSALADSVNPCAIGVIIILISSMIASKNRRYALMAGMIYIAVIFVVYFLLGIGFIYLARSFQIPKLFFIFLGAVLILFGLFSMKDFFWYQKGLSLGIPGPIKKVIEKNIYKTTIASILVIGVLVSIFEATCSGAVYFGILSMIAQAGLSVHSLLLLLLYNLLFVFPLLAILLLFYFGIPAKKVQRLFIQKNRRVYRLILGLILILLGVYLIVVL